MRDFNFKRAVLRQKWYAICRDQWPNKHQQIPLIAPPTPAPVTVVHKMKLRLFGMRFAIIWRHTVCPMSATAIGTNMSTYCWVSGATRRTIGKYDIEISLLWPGVYVMRYSILNARDQHARAQKMLPDFREPEFRM